MWVKQISERTNRDAGEIQFEATETLGDLDVIKTSSLYSLLLLLLNHAMLNLSAHACLRGQSEVFSSSEDSDAWRLVGQSFCPTLEMVSFGQRSWQFSAIELETGKHISVKWFNSTRPMGQWEKPICDISIQDASCCSVKNWFSFSSTSASQCRMMFLFFYVCLNALGRTLTHQLSHRQLSPEVKSILFFSSMQMCDVHDTFFLILIPRSLTAAAANTSVNRNWD